ncbi:MAG: tetratricopeptide repeat protein, partial [Gallionella sp.]
MSSPNRNDPCPCGSGKKFKKCCMGKTSASLGFAVQAGRPPAPQGFNATNVAPPSQLLMQAVALHQAGRLEEARAIYLDLLSINPADSHALHYLGLIALQQGQYADAASLIERAIRADRLMPAFHCNLGNAYKALGQYELAAAAFREAVRLDPQFHVAYCNLGNTYLEQGNLDAARDSYQKALALRADFAEAHYGLGNVLLEQINLDQAAASYRKAIAFRPAYAEAYCNLGSALQKQGRLDEAVASFRQALAIRPNYAEAYCQLGSALQREGGLDEAADCYRKALALKPDFAEAISNLGSIHQRLGDLEQAIACYRQALSINPDIAVALNNLGTAFQDQGKLDAAVEIYNKALLVKPDFAAAYSNLLYLHSFTRDISPESECKLAANWETAILNESERATARNRATSFTNLPRAGRKLKLGIVSAELGQTAVAEFLEPLLEQLDRSCFQLTLYPTAVRLEPKAERFRRLADEYKSLVGLPDETAANLIRSDQIDVLIDTSGHMRDCRLGIFAHRAAPVQCHYIGYHGTSGLTEMDWFIADENLLPTSCDPHFREKIWRLPRLWVAYRGDASLPASNWKPDADGTVWLGSFNNLTKVREETLGLWARAMNALQESRLLLKDSRAADPFVQKRIRTELARHGINGERVEFVSWISGWAAHMSLYDRLDIALDTIPLNSGTTAFDALWMGVPLIALEGNWMGGRMTSTMLKALGKPEWIARDEEEYAAIVAA